MNEIARNPRSRKRIQFSLTLALSGVTLACIAFGWFNWTQRFARANKAMEKLQITVSYDEASNNREKPGQHKLPKWKARIFGEDYCLGMNRLDIGTRSVASTPDFWQKLAKHRSALLEVDVVLLTGIKINEQALDTLQQLPLTEIYFHGCRFDGVSLARLKAFTELQTVLFSRIEQALDYRQLSDCQQLIQVGMDRCKINLETAEYLRAELPETYIFAF